MGVNRNKSFSDTFWNQFLLRDKDKRLFNVLHLSHIVNAICQSQHMRKNGRYHIKALHIL